MNVIAIEEMSDWMREFFDAHRPGRNFTHAPLNLMPFRYVGKLGKAEGLLVICTGTTEADGKRWVHVSFSRRTRVPTYADMVMVRDAFIGSDKLALQLFVPRDQHVNIATTCLHLWHCVDGDPVPDFRRFGQV